MYFKGPWLLGTRVGPLKPTNSTTSQRLEAYVLLQGGKSKNKNNNNNDDDDDEHHHNNNKQNLPHSAALEVKALR